MKYLLLTILFLSLCTIGVSEFRIKKISESDQEEKTSSTLSRNEILLVNLLSYNFSVKCSADKSHWLSKNLQQSSGFEITLDEDDAYFFVQICNNYSATKVNCITYRLTPGKRYVIKLDQETGAVVIKSGRS